jgi:hypothetical protein
MREFHYFDSNVIQVGDLVSGPRGRIGRVEEIVQPDSLESQAYGCPEGGVRFVFDWNGIQSAVMMLPPDGAFWEDIQFISRELLKDGDVRM